MKNTKLNNSLLLRVMAVILSFVLLTSLFSGCDNNDVVSSKIGNPSNPSNIGSSNMNSSQNSEDENAGSETITSQNISPYDGVITYKNSKTFKNAKRDDSDEIMYNSHKVDWNHVLKGYAEKEADALRKEILNTKNTENYYDIKGTKYYISPGGNDENSGTSPDKPLRTVEGLNLIDLEKGDAVLFERDSIFRITQSISAVGGVTYGSYGTGEKPKIYGSPKNFAKAVWKPTNKRNVWQTGYVYNTACNAIFNNGEEIGFIRYSFRDLNENMQFFQDESKGLLYLYCDKGNPSKAYKSIEIATQLNCFAIPNGIHGVTIDNLCLRYAANGGVTFMFDNNNGNITNCEIAYTGGAFLDGHRLGNAIGSWQGNKNMKWDHNWIYQTFDTAISPQGLGGKNCSYENISMSNNLLEYNNADFELWDTDAIFKDIIIDNNICRFTSHGWGTRANDGGYRGIEGVVYGHTDKNDIQGVISFKNNIIDCPAREIINWTVNPDELSKYTISGTKIYVKGGYRTLNVVLRRFRRDKNDLTIYSAGNLNELKTAMLKFDSSAEIKWYD